MAGPDSAIHVDMKHKRFDATRGRREMLGIIEC